MPDDIDRRIAVAGFLIGVLFALTIAPVVIAATTPGG